MSTGLASLLHATPLETLCTHVQEIWASRYVAIEEDHGNLYAALRKQPKSRAHMVVCGLFKLKLHSLPCLINKR